MSGNRRGTGRTLAGVGDSLSGRSARSPLLFAWLWTGDAGECGSVGGGRRRAVLCCDAFSSTSPKGDRDAAEEVGGVRFTADC